MNEFKPSAYIPNLPYQWNYDHPPSDEVAEDLLAGGEQRLPPWPTPCSYGGLPAASPLAVAAGPLLNAAWCRYYARLGFDVLTYKTVRTATRACYPTPNLVPLAVDAFHGDEPEVQSARTMRGTWAVSFGMPSQPPNVWRSDVANLRSELPPEKLLSVSVVGTMQPDWTLANLAEDYAACGQWAQDGGADLIEANFSCPNVASCDGQLYQHPHDAAVVAQTMRARLRADTPLLIKVGHMTDPDQMARLLDALAPSVEAVVAVNSIASRVRGQDAAWLFDGQRRGVCGAAIRDAAVRQVNAMQRAVERLRLPLRVIGVGGVRSWSDVQRYLDVGAEAVQIATAAMLHPAIARDIRLELAQEKPSRKRDSNPTQRP